MEWFINAIYYVVPFIVLLGILVFVHEFGHFIIARLCGVQVEAFSIGFGRKLWSKKDKYGTEWKLSAIPLGGYCQFLGDSDGASTGVDEAVKELSEEEKKKAFPFQNPFKKLAIVVAGPGFNYLFAILIFTVIFTAFGKIIFPPIVGGVIEGSAAEKAGVKSDDRILAINDNEIKSFDDIRKEVALIPDDNMAKLEILRNDQKITLTFPVTELEYAMDGEHKVKQRMLGVKSLNRVEVEHKKMGLGSAFVLACQETWDLTVSTLRGVGQMISGRRSSDELGGIIRIAEMSGDITKKYGILDFVMFVALLSINLGLINLFPIPVLDGGHIVIFLLEIVIGREINNRVKDALFKFGFSLLILLMFFATWNDIEHLIKRWFN